jgi:D-psicose/D-tagatose/L-ribulose 3-epimerase
LFGLLPQVKEYGFDAFEIPVFDPNRVDAVAIRRELEANELACTVCAILPQGLSSIDEDPVVRARTKEHLGRCVALTADLGATLMSGPFYAPVGYLPGRRRNAEEWQWAIECFQELGPVLQTYDVTLAIEPLNRFETFFLNTLADAAALCDAVGDPDIGVLLDTFHANIEEKDIAEACRMLGSRLRHVHACENDRGIPGSGHVDFAGMVDALHEIGYEGCLTIESFGFNLPEMSAAAAIWRDLAASPDAIAREGARYLRTLLAN